MRPMALVNLVMTDDETLVLVNPVMTGNGTYGTGKPGDD